VIAQGWHQAFFINGAEHLRAYFDADEAIFLGHPDSLGDYVYAPLPAGFLVAMAHVVSEAWPFTAYRTFA